MYFENNSQKSIEQMIAFEKSNCFLLPNSFKEFLLNYNDNYYKISSNLGRKYIIQDFYRLTKDSNYSTIYEVYKISSQIIGNYYLPFAYDPAGNWFLISIGNNENYGYIYYYDSDSEEGYEFELIFKSFDALLNHIQKT